MGKLLDVPGCPRLGPVVEANVDCRGFSLDGRSNLLHRTGVLGSGGVAGLGLPCLPAAFAEGPATGSWSGSVVGSGRVLMGRLFFADGFAGMSGLSPSRVTVLGDVVGSRGHVRLVGRMDRERMLCTVVMPKAGRSWPEQRRRIVVQRRGRHQPR